MGFGSMTGQVIIFLAFLVFAGVLFQNVRNHSMHTSTMLKEQRELLSEQLNTRIEFGEIEFTNQTVPCKTTAMLNNTGTVKINPGEMEIYIDGERVERTGIVADIGNDFINPGLWDPGEDITVNASKNIDLGYHTISILSEKGVGGTASYKTASMCPEITYAECIIDSDCDDGNESTLDTCENYACVFTEVECTNDAQCDDGNFTTTDTCVDNECQYSRKTCETGSDCDDEDAGTVDSCIDGYCYNTGEAYDGTCTTNDDCHSWESCIYEECWDGVVGYWNLDSDVNDYSVNDNDATNNGATQISGINKGGYYLDGADSISVPDNNTLNHTEELTVCTWVNLSNTDSIQYIIDKWEWSNGDYRSWSMDISFGDLQWRASNNGQDSGTTTVTYSFSLYPGSWKHICGRYNGTYLGLFVDGNEENRAQINNIISTNNGVCIGAGNTCDPGSWFMSGEIDETLIFNRSLSNAEIEKLYNLGE